MTALEEIKKALEGVTPERLRYEADAMFAAVQGEQYGDTHHAYNWADKPHRVLYDAIGLMRNSASTLESLQRENEVLKIERDAMRAKAVSNSQERNEAERYVRTLSAALAAISLPMNHEALASKAADAVGVTPHSDMRPFVEQAVKWALNEAALSAAEPVAWRWRSTLFSEWNLSEKPPVDQQSMEQLTALNMEGLEWQALYADTVGPDFLDVEEAREKKLATVVAPDNGTTAEVLSAVLECAEAWVPEARIIGNVRAGDIARVVRSALSAQVQDVAGEETTTRFYIEWIAAARPLVHPEPMTGRHIFETFGLALQHMKSQANDAQFVSLEERQTTVIYIDRSADMRAALAAAPAKQEGCHD